MKTVVIQGLGFVGAAMATAVANVTDSNNKSVFDVIGVDLPTENGMERILKINKGIFPFNTSDQKLYKTLQNCIRSGNLKATDDKTVYANADVVVVSINCDLQVKNGFQSIDLNGIKRSISEIVNVIKKETLVIIESTVPPGTCEKIVYPLVQEILKERGLGPNSCYLAHSYERVMPGENYLDSIINYWRVYAGVNKESADRCEQFLSQVVNVKEYPLTRLASTTASEISKLLENSYRAANIAFIEEWGRFAEDVGVDLYEVINAIRKRPTHENIRQPGFGVGGYCLTKDPLFAKIAARDIFNLNGHEFPFSTQAVDVNEKMPLVTLEKINHYYNGSLEGKKILLLGISYRQDVGDTRYSPSEIFYREATQAGAEITGHDPMVEYWEEIGIGVLSTLPLFEGYDAVVFAVPHRYYSEIDFSEWISDGKKSLIFDANNVLSKQQVESILNTNCDYLSIGRG